MNILVLFETSGALSKPLRDNGHYVLTIDKLPHMIDNNNHIICDIFEIDSLNLDYSKFDLLFMFFPCTYFSKAGLHWLYKQPGRFDLQNKYLNLLFKLWSLPIPIKFLENPRGSALNKLFMPSFFSFDYSYFCDFKKAESIWCNIPGIPCFIPSIAPSNKNYGAFITKMPYKKGIYNPRDFTPIEFGYAFVSQLMPYFLKYRSFLCV